MTKEKFTNLEEKRAELYGSSPLVKLVRPINNLIIAKNTMEIMKGRMVKQSLITKSK